MGRPGCIGCHWYPIDVSAAVADSHRGMATKVVQEPLLVGGADGRKYRKLCELWPRPAPNRHCPCELRRPVGAASVDVTTGAVSDSESDEGIGPGASRKTAPTVHVLPPPGLQ